MEQSLTDEDTIKLVAVKLSPENTEGIKSPPASVVTWFTAFKQVMPIYIATHIIFLGLTYLASLFRLGNFTSQALPLTSLLQSWDRWDTNQFTYIATHGYDAAYRTAFFPLFPLLERGLAVVIRDPFVAGLLLANLSTLGVFVVLYRLVAEDFAAEQAWRAVLYLAVFPTAFFFVVAYNESLFLFFALLSFYYLRKGRWWLAALAAFLASLTRSTAICLLLPFLYEYFRQRDFQWRKCDWHILSCAGVVGGIVLFAIYGYLTFHDPLVFSHAQAVWHRQLSFPWSMFIRAIGLIRHDSPLTFTSIHTVIDLSAALFILIILILASVGPWKLARTQWSYLLYAATSYLFVILVPEGGSFPVASVGRFMLELFPAFIVLAAMGQKRNVNLYYLSISASLMAFLLLQWLTGGWMV